MRSITLAILCVIMTLGLALGNNYDYGGSIPDGYYPESTAGGFSNGAFAMLLGFLFIFTILFNSSLFNISTAAPTTNVVLTSG